MTDTMQTMEWECDACGNLEDDSALKCSLCGFGLKPIPTTPDQIYAVIADARQILKDPESWTDCFALGRDDGHDVWDAEDLDRAYRDDAPVQMSLCGALELASHRRKYRKSVVGAVVAILYPICWSRILAPYPYPHELMESHAEGDHYLYEELGYFNDQEGRTHAEVIGVLNSALAHLYAKSIPSLPTPSDAMVRAFAGLAEENKRKR